MRALVAAARGGDMRAFERLYRLHSGKVMGLCLRMTRRRDVAEDCVQQTFIRAWRNLAAFEGRSAFGTWLHRIAVNEVLTPGAQSRHALRIGRRGGRATQQLEPREGTKELRRGRSDGYGAGAGDAAARVASRRRAAGRLWLQPRRSRRDARHRGRHLQGAVASRPASVARAHGTGRRWRRDE